MERKSFKFYIFILLEKIISKSILLFNLILLYLIISFLGFWQDNFFLHALFLSFFVSFLSYLVIDFFYKRKIDEYQIFTRLRENNPKLDFEQINPAANINSNEIASKFWDLYLQDLQKKKIEFKFSFDFDKYDPWQLRYIFSIILTLVMIGNFTLSNKINFNDLFLKFPAKENQLFDIAIHSPEYTELEKIDLIKNGEILINENISIFENAKIEITNFSNKNIIVKYKEENQKQKTIIADKENQEFIVSADSKLRIYATQFIHNALINIKKDEYPFIEIAEIKTLNNGKTILNILYNDDFNIDKAFLVLNLVKQDEIKNIPIEKSAYEDQIKILLNDVNQKNEEKLVEIDLLKTKWSGFDVSAQIEIIDKKGQVSYSNKVKYKLPQKNYANERAKIIQRIIHLLALSPSSINATKALVIYLKNSFIIDSYAYFLLSSFENSIYKIRSIDNTTVNGLYFIADYFEDNKFAILAEKLKNLINELKQAITDGKSKEEIQALLDKLKKLLPEYLYEKSKLQQNANNSMNSQNNSTEQLDNNSFDNFLDNIFKNIDGDKSLSLSLLDNFQKMLESLQVQQNNSQQVIEQFSDIIDKQNDLRSKTSMCTDESCIDELRNDQKEISDKLDDLKNLLPSSDGLDKSIDISKEIENNKNNSKEEIQNSQKNIVENLENIAQEYIENNSTGYFSSQDFDDLYQDDENKKRLIIKKIHDILSYPNLDEEYEKYLLRLLDENS